MPTRAPSAGASMMTPWQLRWQQRAGGFSGEVRGLCREGGNANRKSLFRVSPKQERTPNQLFLLLESEAHERVIKTNHLSYPNGSKGWRPRGATGSWCLSGKRQSQGHRISESWNPMKISPFLCSLKFFFFGGGLHWVFFFCTGSSLWHAGSSLWRAGLL